ncbi:MAG: AMP-binding protein [Alphaproteobacteria bacterium]
MDPALADDIASFHGHYRTSGLWDRARLGERFAANAQSTPDREAIIDLGGTRRTTYRALDLLSNRLAHWLVAHGIDEGDVIAVQLPNCLEAAIIALAANKLGVIVNPMLTVYRAKELRYMLGLTRAKAVFVPDHYRGFAHGALAADIARDIGHALLPVIVDVPEDGSSPPSRWLSALESWPDRPCARTPKATAVSVILFTSGTEAAPKAVMHTEETLNYNIRAVWNAFGMGTDEVVWMPSPVGHSTGFSFGIRIALFHGTKLVLQDRWNPDDAVAIIQRERPTYTLAATVFLTDLLQAAHAKGIDISCLRIFGCGGAPIPPHVVMEAAAKGVNVLRLYGQSETLVATLNAPSSPLQKRFDTDGMVLGGMTCDIRDDDARSLPRGTAGELWVTGPGLSLGYFKDAERTRAKFHRGWVQTGDIATMDADGYVTIVGRKSEIIIRGGMNITPREIEDEIAKIKGISAVAVVGLPDERLGEICCACVVADGSVPVTLETITAALRATGMATYKLPQRLELIPELPTTASGKIQRHRLVAALTTARR